MRGRGGLCELYELYILSGMDGLSGVIGVRKLSLAALQSAEREYGCMFMNLFLCMGWQN